MSFLKFNSTTKPFGTVSAYVALNDMHTNRVRNNNTQHTIK